MCGLKMNHLRFLKAAQVNKPDWLHIWLTDPKHQVDHLLHTFALLIQRPWKKTQSHKSFIIIANLLVKGAQQKTAYTIQMLYFKSHPYCLCWLMAEVSPSCSWLRAWCRADMALPRRSGWMFSLLSSHSTSVPSAIVEIKPARCYSMTKDTHRDLSVSLTCF